MFEESRNVGSGSERKDDQVESSEDVERNMRREVLEMEDRLCDIKVGM